MNFCDARGYLVGGRTPIPTDPHEHAMPNGPLVGCNHLRCKLCGAVVRNWPGVRLAASPHTRAEHAELHATARGAPSRFLTPDGGGQQFRVYGCLCSHTQIASSTDLAHGFIDFDSWACAGHPERP